MVWRVSYLRSFEHRLQPVVVLIEEDKASPRLGSNHRTRPVELSIHSTATARQQTIKVRSVGNEKIPTFPSNLLTTSRNSTFRFQRSTSRRAPTPDYHATGRCEPASSCRGEDLQECHERTECADAAMFALSDSFRHGSANL